MFENKLYELEIPGLPYAVAVDAGWFHCDGEKWQFNSTIEINEIFVNEFRYSIISVSDIIESIELSDLQISVPDSRTIAKKISDFILEKATKTVPKVSAFESYYGYER